MAPSSGQHPHRGRTAFESAWAPIELDVSIWAIETRGLKDLIAVDLDGCLRDESSGLRADSTRSRVVADMSRVVSGEGTLEEAVERVLERLRKR